MSESGNIPKNELMDLPEEILLYILKFVNISSRYNVSQVCKKFYELVCTLERDCLPVELSYEQICDGNIYNSIINTSRMFTDLTIIISVDVVSNIDRILNILMKFGGRIEKFTFSIKPKVLESQLAKMLNYIPNVEKLTFEDICIEHDVNWSDELHLYKLKKLAIESVNDYPIMFNQVPKDVITDMFIDFSFHENEKNFQQFLNRQTQITKLVLDIYCETSLSIVKNFSKLEHLYINFNEEYEMHIAKMIRQNPKLRSLNLNIIFNDNDDDSTGNEIFTSICELKYLESLDISIDNISVDVFKSLTKINNLRELHLNYKYDDDQMDSIIFELSMMKLLQIETLSIKTSEPDELFYTTIPREVIFQFSQNFQNLKHLSFENDSLNIIGTVLKYFIKLETFEFECNSLDNDDQDIFVIDEDLKHENLKEFTVNHIASKNTNSILNAISACPNLELIEIFDICEITHEEFQQIVDDHPKLKCLRVEMDEFNFQYKTAELIQSAARRLQMISLSGLSPFLSFETIKERFKEEFSCIKQNFNETKTAFTLKMKKRGPYF
ncbi:CLUMA_CG009720, isoform A [Clunio marinus]|uniref:CLUMA_CG009720, isoform A n=1 Tax=Clunio marinus TaxID=568069 RepID=A0A1J1I7N5_9DIPT|nr:CLUMA_CG009720, isoform A [Clunio marinus]